MKIMIHAVLMPDADPLVPGIPGVFNQITKGLFFLTGKLPYDFFKYVMPIFFNQHAPLLFGFVGRLKIIRLVTSSETNGIFKIIFFELE